MRAISVFSYALFWPIIWPISIYWFLYILKLSLLPYPNTQSPDVIAYLRFDYTTSQLSLLTSLAVYNQVKKLNTGECAHVLGQKKCSLQRVGVLQIVFWLSGKYMQDLRFVNRTRNSRIFRFYAWIFFNLILFLHSSEENSLCMS